MSDEVKKISFGFSKLAKPKTAIISNNKSVKSEESVQFIDCVEDKSIKVKDEGPKKPDFLVIPLPKQSVADNKRRELLHRILNNTADEDDKEALKVDNVSIPIDSTKTETLDEIAAREIVEDLKKVKETADDAQNFTVPLNADTLAGGKEATLDDYESIPVDKFGLAMLRGMGWAPGKGIGKTEQVISAKQPLLRPKGLGLGADKVLKTNEKSTKVDEPLKLIKGSFVRIIAGAHQNLFGEVIGFDDETGRLIVKMALGNNAITFNEFMVQVISKDDFDKNSKVINVKKYEEYKLKETSEGVILPDPVRQKKRSSESSDEQKSVKRRPESKRHLSSSPERKKKDNSSKTRDIYRKTKRTPSTDTSSERHSSKYKHSQKQLKRESRSSDSSSADRRGSKHSYKEYSKKKNNRSSSEESITRKHISRKELTRRTRSSSESTPEKHYSKEKKSNKNRRHSSSSSYSSDETTKKKHRSDYKKKCKKNKEKKKSKRRSRSYSGERIKKSKSHGKHKKSKY